jgi:hypothetical protein
MSATVGHSTVSGFAVSISRGRAMDSLIVGLTSSRYAIMRIIC